MTSRERLLAALLALAGLIGAFQVGRVAGSVEAASWWCGAMHAGPGRYSFRDEVVVCEWNDFGRDGVAWEDL